MTGIEMLSGKTLTSISVNESKDEILFTTNQNEIFKMYHDQDCCESVYVEEIIGDLDDLLNVTILMCEEVSQVNENASESGTWTFYKLATLNGYVTIRWYGESNGYYSEDVDFVKMGGII